MSVPTTLEFPERDWNRNRVNLYSCCCYSDNTWIPWKGLKHRYKLNDMAALFPDNTWIPWKGLKQKGTAKVPFRTMPTTLEFPERDWNKPVVGWCFTRNPLGRQHLNSLKGIETMISWFSIIAVLFMPTTLEFPERDWNNSFIDTILSNNGYRQHLNSLKGIETSIFRYSNSHQS